MPAAAQSAQMVGDDPHASSASPATQVPSGMQQLPQDLKSQGDQQTTP
jgi:hypothetical protein